MTDLELFTQLAESDAAMAKALMLVVEEMKVMRAEIDALAFIQRAGKRVDDQKAA